MKRILVVLMALVMVLAMTACGGSGGDAGSADNAAEPAAAMTVKLDIDYPDESGVSDVDETAVEIPEGGTVLDALNAYAEANNCEVLMDESSDSPYVTSIGGVAATDVAGWVYEVNDEMVMESADACVLNAGDEVSWSFESWGD